MLDAYKSLESSCGMCIKMELSSQIRNVRFLCISLNVAINKKQMLPDKEKKIKQDLIKIFLKTSIINIEY